MSARRIKIKEIPLEQENQFIEVDITYNQGGTNMFTYKQEPRGYYLHVQPVTVKGGMKSFVAFTGFKSFIESAGRFNARRLRQLADTDHGQRLEDMIRYVEQKQGVQRKTQ